MWVIEQFIDCCAYLDVTLFEWWVMFFLESDIPGADVRPSKIGYSGSRGPPNSINAALEPPQSAGAGPWGPPNSVTPWSRLNQLGRTPGGVVQIDFCEIPPTSARFFASHTLSGITITSRNERFTMSRYRQISDFLSNST